MDETIISSLRKQVVAYQDMTGDRRKKKRNKGLVLRADEHSDMQSVALGVGGNASNTA